MGARPNIIQRWGNAAGSGALVQPPTGTAGAGFATAERPPAQWINWNFSNYASWIDFLRGPNYEHWTRTAWGTSPATYDSSSPVLLAVDATTVDSTGAAYRYVIAGWETSGSTPSLRVSQRGNAWSRLTNITASPDLPTALAYFPAQTRWLLADATPALYYCTRDAGGATGPIGSGSGNWSTATTPGAMTAVAAIAANGSAAFALTTDGGAYTTDGVTWTAYAGTSGTSRSGNGSDVVWTGSAFVFITTDGQIYKSTTAGGTFAYQTDLGGTYTWRLATDSNGGVLAYRVNNGSTLDLFWSDDNGGTWATITPTSGFIRIQRIRHHEGTWLACSTVAPFLWASNDHETWTRLRMPVSGSDLALYDLAWDGGAWIVAGNGWVLQCPRGHDPSDADTTWTPGSTATRLIDAAYLRGREVSATAPTNGQVLTWNNSGGYWEPTTVSGGSLPTASGADEFPLSTGAGTTYTARTASEVRGITNNRTVYNLSTGAGLTASTTGDASTTFGGGALALAVGGTVDPSVAQVVSNTLLPDSFDVNLALRVDIVTGDGTLGANGQLLMRIGDGTNWVGFVTKSDGTYEINSSAGGSAIASGSSGISSGDRTGGDLWLMITRTRASLLFSYAISSSTPPPASAWNIIAEVTTRAVVDRARGTWGLVAIYVPATAAYRADILDLRTSAGNL